LSTPEDLRQRRLLRWCLVGWMLLGAILLVRAVARPADKGVILAHVEFGRRLATGQPLYAPSPLAQDGPDQPLHPPYPPSFGLLAMPFAGLAALGGPAVARAGWALMQLACAVGVARLLRRLAGPAGAALTAGQWHGVWLLLVLLGGRFLFRDLHGGGGNLVNLWLCLAAVAAAQNGRAGRAGLLLGFSLATKPTQVWLVPVLLLFGWRRTVGWTLASGATLVLLSWALLHFDPSSWLRWGQGSTALASQADAFAVPELGFPKFTWMNQSLRCAVARYCGSVPEAFAAQVELWPPAGLGLPVPWVAAVLRGLQGLLLVALGVAAWRARRHTAAQPAVLAAALVASLLLSPLSWKGHHTALLPVLLGCLLAAWHGARGARWLLGAWFVTCALPGRDLLGRMPLGDRLDELGNSLYLVTLGDLLLFAVALRAAVAAPFQSAPAQSAPFPSAPLQHGDAEVGAAAGQRLR
jgi:hypothetical protein